MKKSNNEISNGVDLISLYKISVLCLALIVSFAFCDKAKAIGDSSYLSFGQELRQYIRSGASSLGRQCRDEIDRSANSNNVAATIERARGKRNCRAVKLYLGAIEYGSDEQKQQARFEIIDAYDSAGDEIGAMKAAKIYINEHGQNETVRVKIIRIARGSFSTVVGRDPLWEKMVLNEHSAQTLENPFFQYIIADKFFRDYPNSSHRPEVQQIQNLAASNIDDHFMSIVNFYMRRREYKAAILRLQTVLARGPESQIYGEGLHTSIEAYVKLAQQVSDVGRGRVIRSIGLRRIDEDRVRAILDIAPLQRLDASLHEKYLLDQASILMGYMEDFIPGDSWTRKAQGFFQ